MISNWALLKKNLLLAHGDGKYPEEGSGLGAISMKSGQGPNQTGRSTAETSLEQNQPITPETGIRTGSRTGSGTGSRKVYEPVSPSIQARLENVSVDPLTP